MGICLSYYVQDCSTMRISYFINLAVTRGVIFLPLKMKNIFSKALWSAEEYKINQWHLNRLQLLLVCDSDNIFLHWEVWTLRQKWKTDSREASLTKPPWEYILKPQFKRVQAQEGWMGSYSVNQRETKKKKKKRMAECGKGYLWKNNKMEMQISRNVEAEKSDWR